MTGRVAFANDFRPLALALHRRWSASRGVAVGSIEDQAFLALALAGEVGELANIVKKLWRQDAAAAAPRRGLARLLFWRRHNAAARQAELLAAAREECADVLIYLVLIAAALDVDLELAAWLKQNRVLDERYPEWAAEIRLAVAA